MWEKNLEDYRHSLHYLPESREAVNPLLESAQKGREEIISSLMSMNARYEKLLNEVQLAMENLVETLKRHGKEHKEVSRCLSQINPTLYLTIDLTKCTTFIARLS